MFKLDIRIAFSRTYCIRLIDAAKFQQLPARQHPLLCRYLYVRRPAVLGDCTSKQNTSADRACARHNAGSSFCSIAGTIEAGRRNLRTSSFAPPTDVALAPNHHRHALALPPHPQLVARRAESPVPPPPRLCSQLKRPAARGLCHRRQPPAPVLPQLTQALGAFGRATTPDFNTTDSKKTGCCNLWYYVAPSLC
ncbi:hypothetical protein BD779DRAFT_1547527 [Infundibulicybe gibba]|nr:hypothetical protein BD779DRAFT_1547527 [Infundibulicybe gibba]